MRKFLLFVVLILAAGIASAETVYLKSGVTATGKIVSKNDTNIVLDIGGATVTYYMDEIDRIDDGSVAAAVESSAVASGNDAVSVSASKRELIMQFIDAFGTRTSMKANFDQMMASLSKEEASKLRGAFNVDEIIERLIPLYDKHMSESDLKEYIAFYGSQDGKKLVAAIPKIMSGSVEISAQYFEERMPEEFKKAPVQAGAAEQPVVEEK